MEANNDIIELCSLTSHHVHKLFYSLELIQEPSDKPEKLAENFFHTHAIDGNWLLKSNSPQYLRDVFPHMRFSEVILLLVTLLQHSDLQFFAFAITTL